MIFFFSLIFFLQSQALNSKHEDKFLRAKQLEYKLEQVIKKDTCIPTYLVKEASTHIKLD